jgi:hypothetical protein
MSGVALSLAEEAELYVLLKPRETELGGALSGLLSRIEKALFERLTVAEMEQLISRFPPER